MTCKFKAGDRVVVIATDGYFPKKYPIGRVLTVSDVLGTGNGACLRFYEEEGGPYAHKFALYVEPPAPMSDIEYNDVIASQEAYSSLVDG